MKSEYSQAKYVVLFSMLYCVALVTPIVLAYRTVSLGPFLAIPGGALVFPSTYLFGDVISEVYGYKVARQLLWCAIVCEFVFAIFVTFIIYLPHPDFWVDDASYKLVLGKSLRFVVASALGTTVSEFLNIYILTKTKIYYQGKLFWYRCLLSSMIGETFLTVIVYSVAFIGINTFGDIIDLMIYGYMYKVLFSILSVIPAILIVKYLKKAESIDVLDTNTNFSPFSFSLQDSERRT